MTQLVSENIVVIDPSPFFLDGICGCLNQVERVMTSQVTNLADALRLLDMLRPRLVLIGPNLPGHEALVVCRHLAARAPDLNIIVLTPGADDPAFQIDAIHAGAVACRPPTISDIDCLRMADEVINGRMVVPSEIQAAAQQPIDLTRREREVLQLMAKQKTDKEIAEAMVIAFPTARKHAHHILEKLGVNNRQDAIRRARRRGLI